MALQFLVNRLKALFLLLLGAFRRAMCCFRRRRRSSCDSIPLSAVGVVPDLLNNREELVQWEQWEENPVVIVSNKPINPIQEKIDQYRQQVFKPPSPEEELHPNFFEDMTPNITKQTKILIRDKKSENVNNSSSKFEIMTDPLPTNELKEWEENATGWEEETAEEFGDPTEVLREQRKREREQRLYEQQQKRLEKHLRPQLLGAKITS
ncbi:receptor-binding cancer antigen expressed on SiSo cells isoform X1 [Leptopilina boulardi]|uniref:receptor-binding cancer antigen expressed on SiSo cells isoform X1 n=2 Tax=Leptopilina boulardi TaxID=63433 RepID=UPI0021F539A0|nr:receptor-binding cancer antigen expressed on SiSo cells isoform X1 [Leptopilina boulardi]